MDEEGTVVYYETSPAVESLQYEGDDVQEIVFSEQQPLEVEEKDCKQSAGESIKSLSVFWKKILSIWVDHTHIEQDGYTERVITSLRESPLLTEEDFQLLYFSLPPSLENTCLSKISTPSLWKGIRSSRLVVVSSIFFAVVACGLAVNRALLFVCGAGVLAIAAAGVVLAKWIRYRYIQKLEDSIKALTLYTSEMEALLSLLTRAIRTIQETEIISHGYSRPSRTVPISRVEKRTSSYQCLVLRRRVFHVCRQGTVLLRKRTQFLHENYPLNEELDSVHGYLAFSPLEQLHPHLLDGESETDCGAENLPSLSLESLKDACNLLAVQNSELFRRLALNLGRLRLTASGSETLNLPELPGVLTEAQHFASEACVQLKWSLEFHKNYLFGEPPIRKLLKPSGGRPVLQPVLDEVHCMDLKTQHTLKRIREVGVVLMKLSSATEAALVQNSTAESLREQLLSIQHDMEDIAGHITDGVQFLNKLLGPESIQDKSDEQRDVGTMPDAASAELQQEDSEDEETSDEEMVFEAYIPPLAADSEIESGNVKLTKEEREEMERHLREAKQAPLRMMKELQSVLAIRSVQKEKRKEERRHRKKKKNQLPERSSAEAKLSDSHPTSPWTEELGHGVIESDEVPVEERGSDSIRNDVEASLKPTVTVSASPSVTALDGNPCRYTSVSGQYGDGTESCLTPGDSHLDAEITHSRNLSEAETTTTLNPTLDCVDRPPAAVPPVVMPVGVCSLQLAQEAAAVAVRSSRVKAEEVFEDVDSEEEAGVTPCSHAPEESCDL